MLLLASRRAGVKELGVRWGGEQRGTGGARGGGAGLLAAAPA